MTKKLTAFIAIAFFFTVVFNLSTSIESVSANDAQIHSIENPLHEFTITFNENVKNNVDNLNKIYIHSENITHQELSISLSTNSKKVIVKPKNPYIYGETYTLVVPAGVESSKGGKTTKQVKHQFEVKGNYIQSISANYTSLVTNVNVIAQKNSSIERVTITLENGTEMTLNSKYRPEFSRGFMGLLPGDIFKVDVYNSSNNLVETQYYKVQN